MTVRLLVAWEDPSDRKKYAANNLLTTDAPTEAGLVAAKLADTNLTGGTAYVPAPVAPQRLPVYITEAGRLVDWADNTVSGGAPITINGIAAVGNTLTAAIAAGWQNSGGNWTRDGANISGASSLAYPLVTADNDKNVTYKSSNIPYIPPAVRIGGAAATAPGAPTIGTATAGDGTVSVAFTAPASNGGSAILDYQVLLSTGQTATGASSPISVAAPNGTPVTATVRARNAVGYGPASAASNSVTPAAGVAAPTWTTQPSVSGFPEQGQPLTAVDGVIADGTLTGRQWHVEGIDVADETGATYIPSSSDLDKVVGCRWSATGPGGPATNTKDGATVVSRPYVLMATRTATNARELANSAGHVSIDQRMVVRNGLDVAVDSVVLRFGNHVAAGALLNNQSISTTLEVGLSTSTSANPSRTRAAFGEASAPIITMTPGQVVDTRPTAIAIAAGAELSVFESIRFASAPPMYPSSIIQSAMGNDLSEAATTVVASKAITGQIIGRAASLQIMPPIAIYGRPVGSPTKARVLVVTDSIGGPGANGTASSGYAGWIQRGLGALLPWTNTGQAGFSLTAARTNTADWARKMSVLRAGAFTHVLVALSTNDFASGRTGAQAYADLVWLKSYFDARGIKLIATTGYPRTNAANDGPNSVGGAAATTAALAFRDLVVEGNGGGHGHFDSYGLVCDPANPQFWLSTGGNPSTDGIHPAEWLHTLLFAPLRDGIPALFSLG